MSCSRCHQGVKPDGLVYLSPSSVKDWNRCPHRFKLMRLDGHKIERQETLSTAVGTVFDAHVKCRLDRRLKLDFLLKDIKNDDAIKIGSVLCNVYDKCGALKNLIEEGVGFVELDKETLIGGVPLYGKPDAIMSDGTPLDWKTTLRGSVVKGWSRLVTWGTIANAVVNDQQSLSVLPLEEINYDWALQVVLYAFLGGHKPGKPLRGRIDYIVMQENSIHVASYNSPIMPNFQLQQIESLQHIWKSVQQSQFPPPEYSTHRCLMYGKRCEVADKCSAFQAGEFTSDSLSNLGTLFEKP